MRRDITFIRWAAIAATTFVLAGCATNPGLAKFGDAATALADSYRPILSSPSRVCSDSRTLMVIATEPRYDHQKALKDSVLAKCANLAERQATRMVVADAIAAYGQQLTLLAGADPAALTPDIEGVASAATAIKNKGGDPLFNASKIEALSKFTSILVELVRAGAARKTAKDVMTQAQQPLESLVEEMKVWTNMAVIPDLTTGIEVRQSLLGGLVELSTAKGTQTPMDTYPFRTAQIVLLQDIGNLQQEKKAAEAFLPAATEFVETHRKLRETFDSSSKEAQVAAVRGFIDKVLELRKAAQAL